ncbi:PREDICTED: glutathione synthetase, chloroplastic-like [Populus euphratica]|uniref:Glutathione synthetase n=1 Tax=Populus euphratica TaxID=75702 RepID=A0AAJ6VIA1_POPEU|nr:PREDICTED: glutathione synthetase, chloroplastic-like [Populus euphratica]
MGVAYSSLPSPFPCTATIHITGSSLFPYASKANPERVINSIFNHTNNICLANLQKPTKKFGSFSRFSHHSTCLGSKIVPSKCCAKVREMETQERILQKPLIDFHGIDEELVQKMVYDALVWSSLHGLVVGDKSVQRSGKVPGVGLVHAPFALLPMAFPESQWNLACEVAPIFNELIDRVSLDGKFLQDALSRTKKVDAFTSGLLDIHSKMLEINKKEEIRLGLHRSDYMLDEQTKLLLQIELNTISASFPGLGCRVSELHRSLLNYHGEHIGLDPRRIPGNTSVDKFAEALAKAWTEHNRPRALVMVVVQPEECNMYDQHWLCAALKDRHNVTTIRKTLAEIDKEGEILPDGTLLVGGQEISVVYFRAGYAPTDYPSEAEWRARLLMEQSSAVKCPSISYHLAGTKKIQQELAKPNMLERFLENKEDISKLQKCFAGLWSLEDSDIIKKAIERPELFVMKPQREGGGNNFYGDDVRTNLVRLQKEGTQEDAAYILMQRIFPTVSPTILVREGICHKDHAISELGVYGAYLRNKEKVIVNEQCGYLMRTKVSSSNEGGVAAGFAVLDSIYLS